MPMKRSLFGAGDGGGRQHVEISGSYISAMQSGMWREPTRRKFQ